MKTIAFLITIVLLNITAFANSNDSLKNTSSKKNEIGAILNPVGIILLGSTPYGQRIGLTLKRASKEPNIYFTAGAYYQGYNSNNNLDKRNEVTLEVNGLLRKIEYNKASANKGIVSFGVEKRWTVSQCPAIVSYVGFEYQISYGVENTNIGNQLMKADSLQSSEPSIQALQPVSSFTQTKSITKTSFSSGVQINAGLQFHLSKYFYLFAQTAPSMILSSNTLIDENIVTQTKTKYKTSQFDFDTRALVSDIGMVFKF